MTEFLSQLEQFRNFDGLGTISNTLQELVSSLHSNQALQATALVGRKVFVTSNNFSLMNKSSVTFAVDYVEGITNLSASIFAETDELVKTISLDLTVSGLLQFIWDGTNQLGQPVESARYRIEIAGIEEDLPVFLKPMILANVNSVSLGHTGESLRLHVSGVGPVFLGQVRKVTV